MQRWLRLPWVQHGKRKGEVKTKSIENREVGRTVHPARAAVTGTWFDEYQNGDSL